MTDNLLKLNLDGTENSFVLDSYGNQDRAPQLNISADLFQVELGGNSWKKIALSNGYTIAENTLLEFEFQSNTEGEIHGIGFDLDNSIFGSGVNRFQLFGTERNGRQTFNTYDPSQGLQSYQIPVGKFFTGDFNYLTLMNDHDVVNPTAQSLFQNLKLYEAQAAIKLGETSVTSDVTAYGNQDRNSFISFSEDLTAIELDGNGWKKIALGNGYTIAENTVLEFDFQSNAEGEAHGIGFDTDNSLAGSGANRFQLFGTERNGRQNFKTYDPSQGLQSYQIPVGRFFTGDFNYLTLINDHDVENPTAESLFQNLNIYEQEVAITLGETIDNFDLTSYSGQDKAPFVSISDDRSQLEIQGNAWKKIALGDGYNITDDTVLEFEFQSTVEGEIHAIGFDNDNILRGSGANRFQLYGTERNSKQQFNNYDPSQGWQSYQISVGDFFTGEFDYLTLVNDHDVDNPNAQSLFRNIKIYEAQEETPPPPPATEPVRIEAENMTLNGYDTEAKTFASGGSLIRIPNDGNISTATTNFSGASGVYDVNIGYHDENDGLSQLSVKVGDQLVDTWTFDQNLGSTRASATNFVERNIASGLQVNAGESIEIEGILNNGEVARVDYIEFVPPVGEPAPDTSAPTASLNATNFTATEGDNTPYILTVNYTDNLGVDVSSLDSSDVRVTGPNGFDQLATFVGVNTNNEATYEINAPGGNWETNEGGTYSVSLQGNQVSDTAGNFAASGALGSFQVNVESSPPPPPSDTTANYSSAPRGIIARLDSDFVLTPKFDRPLKIMPLGDSITQGKVNKFIPEAEREGYRAFLWDKFADLGLDIDFVGSQSNGTSNLPDKDHEGHSGWRINQIHTEVNGWLDTSKPDVVLLKIGTNDSSGSGETMASRLDGLIDRITSNSTFSNSSFTGDLLVSTIPPIHPNSFYYDSRMPNILDYNSRIPGIVNSKPASEKVHFVDTWAGSNGLKETDMTAPPADNSLHPGFQGYEKIAQSWYDEVLKSGAAGQKDTVNQTNVLGSAYDDTIVGDSANNTLSGGAGDDELTGGSGADIFAYEAPTDGEDILTDFDGSQGDVFQISASGFGGGLSAGVNLSSGVAATGTFVSSSTPTSLGSSANFLYDTDTGWLGFDLDGTGAVAAVTIATLDGAPILNASQFAIVA